MPARQALAATVVLAALGSVLGGCLPSTTLGTLRPALSFVDTTGGRVAVEHGIAVPSFERQPRPRIDLDGPWRVEDASLDGDLSLTDRAQALAAIEREAGGRQATAFDDSTWDTVPVPGMLDPPPRAPVGGAWYRRHVDVPATWDGRSVTLKFEAANYVVDVWLNGTYLGAHEGGATPFAFDATAALAPGRDNVLAVRVDEPDLGTRVDTVPWGLLDWWSYAGLTGSVWLEASDPVRAARADVVPHLDGADVSVVIENRTDGPVAPAVQLDVYAANLTPANLLDPDPASLLPPLPAVPSNPRLPPAEIGGRPEPAVGRLPVPERPTVTSATLASPTIRARSAAVVTTSLLIPDPALWDLGRPSLYVLRVTVDRPAGGTDSLMETFGLRRIAVDPTAPRLLLNGRAVSLVGAAVHDEVLEPAAAGSTSTIAPQGAPLSTAADALAQLRRAMSVNANFIRAGHEPADANLLRLADRLGIAIWEEIPLYHFTPLTFDAARTRGVAAQLLTEMALRDMNRPSVLFHGLSNESTGGDERTAALAALRDVDRDVDGTRLTGQAAYGFDAADGTSDPLDVVGITSYFGVFYGVDPDADTAAALDAAHARYPKKPVMILEFGHWADTPADEAEQTRIFRATEAAVAPRRDTIEGGFVGSLVWWSLDDYLTSRPGLTIERFGLFAPDGTPRPVAAVLGARFAALDQPPPVVRQPPRQPGREAVDEPPMLAALLLTLAIGLGGPLAIVALLTARGHRRTQPARRALVS
ncbi:MAG TPA: glycoside hydrolase family 2 TIM barrel-domain containing protein [Candidatus Limnocylindrales bacterium]|nr:glycoside hydrolase family 2 TIM barrel-domain containing protein [Candidatus Limnocylindrales bacterium]